MKASHSVLQPVPDAAALRKVREILDMIFRRCDGNDTVNVHTGERSQCTMFGSSR